MEMEMVCSGESGGKKKIKRETKDRERISAHDQTGNWESFQSWNKTIMQ
jgi:hypothetical protein